jgi:hypothetical protein
MPLTWLKPAAVAAAIGLAIGAWCAHLFYAPRLDLAQSRVDALSGALETQNRAVVRLEQSAKERAAAAKKAVEEARRQAEKEFEEALGILTQQPPPGVDRCTAASALVRQELAK